VSPDQLKERRTAFLDQIMRKGILAAYSHGPEHVKIVDVLLRNLCTLNQALGIESVKHLKYILPMLNTVLSDPFSTVYPPVLLSAIKALQSVILNAWPRMTANLGEVLKGLTLCWLRMCDDAGSELVQVKDEAIKAVKMLRQAVQGECDFDAECTALIDADERLGELLKPI